MRIAILSAALIAGTWVAFAGEGQGKVDPGRIDLDGANLGTYWYGAQIDKRALAGKVVLFEIWGS